MHIFQNLYFVSYIYLYLQIYAKFEFGHYNGIIEIM